MLSLLENHKHLSSLNIYWLSLDISEKSKREVEVLVSGYGRTAQIIDAGEHLDKIRVWPKEDNAYYIRLLTPTLINEDKVLYLDCDTVVSENLQTLWETDISEYWLAAVQDVTGLTARTSVGLSRDDRYFNDGIMLLNCAAWRDEDVLDRCLSFRSLPGYDWGYKDQAVLNGVCKGHVLFVEPKYNAMAPIMSSSQRSLTRRIGTEYYSKDELRSAKKEPAIIHYAGYDFFRPWNAFCVHPGKARWNQYESMIDPKEKIRNRKWPWVKYRIKTSWVYPLIRKIYRFRR